MPDLTDSFCERCGTRYAFVSGAPKGLSLKSARVLAKGLKNFVLTDGQSITDAMELARQEDGRDASTRVTEAFHRTFNFCMSCRQYACDSCWNPVAGECFSCAPASETAPYPGLGGAEDQPGREESFAAGERTTWPTAATAASSDWSLAPDEPVVEAAEPPAPFYQPVTFSEREPGTTSRPVSPIAWPKVDLPDTQPVEAAGSNGRNHAIRSADSDAALQWPIADEIAPEMTLTPEELDLIEAQLSQSQASPISPVEEEPAPVAPLLERTATWWNKQSDDADEAATADWALPVSSTEEPATRSFADAASQANEVAAEEPALLPQAVEGPLETVAAELEPDQTDGSLPAHLLHIAASNPTLPPLASITPPAPVAEPSGLVARLLGRHAPGAPAAQATPRRVSTSKGQVSGDPWPLATAWMNRSFEGAHWSRGVYATADRGPAGDDAEDPVPELVDATTGDMPEQESAVTVSSEALPTLSMTADAAPGTERTEIAPEPLAPAPVVPSTAEIDLRAAAALRLPAVDAATSAPVESSTANIDPRAAAALRLSAVDAARAANPEPETNSDWLAVAELDGTRPYADEPPFESAPAEPTRGSETREPAWLRVQREAAEVPGRPSEMPAREDVAPAAVVQPEMPASTEAQDQAAATAATAEPAAAASTQPVAVTPQPRHERAPVPVPAGPWPPLGASWPTRESPGAPWPGPAASAVPAVVAAQQIPAQTMAEMWVESSQEVMNRGSVRVCRQCALPVSTRARFCRRCGTPQS